MVIANIEESINMNIAAQIDKGFVTDKTWNLQAQVAAESKLGQAMAKKPKLDHAWQTIAVYRASDNSHPLRKSQVDHMRKTLQPFPKMAKDFEHWIDNVWNIAHNTSGTIFDDTTPVTNKLQPLNGPPETDPAQTPTTRTMKISDISGGKKWEDFKSALADTPLPYAWHTPWSHIFNLVLIAMAKSVVASWIRWGFIAEPMSWIFALGMGCNLMGDLVQTKGVCDGLLPIKFAAL
jgi:hypothetical protein